MTASKQKKLRILVGEFHQESNSFNPVVSDIGSFRAGILCEGAALFPQYDGLPCAVNGMFSAIREAGGEIIPAYAMRAQSGGKVDQAVMERFIAKTQRYIQENRPLDGMFLSLHGATQTTAIDDACGAALQAIREALGPDAVLAASCDLHANVTEKMLRNADIVCGYQSYPHIDFYETGYRAASLGLRKILGGKPLSLARAVVPMIVPAMGYSSGYSPFKDLIEYAKSLVENKVLLDFSIFQMQPWLDVDPAGSSVTAVAGDASVAKEYAAKLARMLFESRDAFWPRLHSIDEVIDLARQNKSGKPVILVDSADSPNAGAVGDSVAAVLRLLARGVDIKAATVVNDAAAVEQAFQVGVGNSATFCIGAKKTPGMPGPLSADALVRSLHDGKYVQEGPAGRGCQLNIGRAAVVSIGKIDILLCSNPSGTGDLQIYRHFGIEPTFYQLMVVKACTSFRAGYTPIAAKICVCDTPGAASANLKGFDFRRIAKDFYPFSPLDGYRLPEPAVYR